MTNTITLGGRKFVGLAQDITASQEDYLFGHLRQAGALNLEGDLDGAERTREQRAEEMLTKILLTGRKHFLVAGALTEEGKIWNWQDADANATRFAKLTAAEDKKAMQTCIVALVIGFFMTDEQSLGTPSKAPNGSEKGSRAKKETA